uniref:Seipin n=1 Tax=Globodera rostochiensis TaxID=31243 RepID=A0A914I3T1_GLORO
MRKNPQTCEPCLSTTNTINNYQMLFSFCLRFLSGPLFYAWHSVRKQFSLAAIITLCIRLISLFMMALITPIVLRRMFASNFVELQQPLEFIFKTCSDELAGVCSFPEAQFSLEEEDIQLQPGYYYSFVLDIVLFDTMQNRQLSIVLASVMLKDERVKLLYQFHKSVPIFNAFTARSVISRLYTLTRNMFFWPLYLAGFFSSSGHELSELFSIHFPSYYLERESRPTRLVVVQLQNKFIQLSSAQLRVRTHLNILSAFVSEYPLLSYVLMFCACFSLFFSTFAIFHFVQWARRWTAPTNAIIDSTMDNDSLEEILDTTMFVSSSTPSVSGQFFVANNAISPTALAPQLLLPPCPGACGWRPTSALLLSDNLTSQTSGDGITTQFADGDRIAAMDEEAIIELIFAHCRPCPWGTRRWWHNSATNGGGGDSLCRPCETPLRTFDYLFLLFHVIVPFVLNSVAICYNADRMRQTRRLLLWTVCQLVCALLECSLAFIGALLIFRPFGELRTFGCSREGKLEEWYSMWNNPVLHYSRVLHCSSELVYPLYSLPFVIYALNLATLLIVRSLLHITIATFCNTSLPSAPFYAALWALPLLALAHAVLSGVLFALFPFIALLAALLHLVVHLSVRATHRTRSPSTASTAVSSPATTVGGMFRLLLSTAYHRGRPVPLWLPWLVHLALFAFALLSLLIAFGAPNSGQMAELVATLFGGTRSLLALTLCVLLPLPTLFFILTIRLTAPGSIALANRCLS